VVELDLPRLQNGARHASADKGTIYLRRTTPWIAFWPTATFGSNPRFRVGESQSNQVELLMAEKQDNLRSATFLGDVRMENSVRIPCRGAPGGWS